MHLCVQLRRACHVRQAIAVAEVERVQRGAAREPCTHRGSALMIIPQAWCTWGCKHVCAGRKYAQIYMHTQV